MRHGEEELNELIAAAFQYRKRYEVTCDIAAPVAFGIAWGGFNTASGMRSHATRMFQIILRKKDVSIPQAV